MYSTRSSVLALAALLLPAVSSGDQSVTYDNGENDSASYDTSGGNLDLYAQGSPQSSATQSGPITGSGSVDKRSNGTLRLTALNSYTAGTTISEGRLSLERSNNDGVGTIRNDVWVSRAGTLQTTTTNALGYIPGEKVNRIELMSGAKYLNPAEGDQGWGVNYVLRGDAFLSSNNAHAVAAGNSATAPSYFTLGGPAGANSSVVAEFGQIGFVSRILGRVDLRGDNGNSAVEFRCNEDAALAIDASVTGNAGILKTGVGLLDLNGINTYIGTTTINGGSIRINAANSGTGGIRSPLVINGGNICLGAVNTLGYVPGEKVDAITINNGLLFSTAAGDQGWGIAYTLNGGEMRTNGGVADPNTPNKFAFGNFTTVTVGAGSAPRISGHVDLRSDFNPDTDITVGANGNLKIDAAVTGGGGIKKFGPGTITLTAANSFLGTLTISAGSVVANAPSLPGNVVNNGAIVLTSEGNCPATISGNGTVQKTQAGTVGLSGTNSYTGGTTLSGGFLFFSDNANLGAASAPLTFAGGGLTTATDVTLSRPLLASSTVLLKPTSGALTVGNAIPGAVGLEKSGGGTVVLNAINTYNGATTVQEGRLVLAGGSGNSGAIRGTLTVNPGTTLEVSSAAAMGRAEGEKVTAVNVSGATLTSSGSASIGASVPFTIGGNEMTTLISGRLDLQPGNSFNVTGNAILNVTAEVSSSGGEPGLLKKGPGKMILAGQSSYAGTTSVEQGTMQVIHPQGTRYQVSRAQPGPGSVLEFGGNSVVNHPGGAAQSMLADNFGFIDFRGNSSAGSASYVASGNAGINFFDSSTAGSGTYTIGNGSIASSSNIGFLDSANAGSATFTLLPGGTFGFITGNTSAVGAKVITQAGSWIGSVSGVGTFRIGSLSGAGELALGTATISLGALGLDDVFSGKIRDTGALEKTGSGTLTLSGTSTYTGGTTISGGKLLANNTTGSALGSGATSVATGATLGGHGFIGGSTTVHSGARLSPGNSSGTLSFSSGLALGAGAILDLQLGSTSDLIRVSGGALTGPSSGKITVNLSDVGAFSGNTYTLIDATGAIMSNLTADSFALGTTIPGYNYSFTVVGPLVQITAISTDPYEAWSSVISDPAQRGRTADPDGDGFTNLMEYLFGSSAILPTASLMETERTPEGLLIRWLQRNSGTSYQLQESTDFSNPWPASGLPVIDGDQSGIAPDYTRKQALAPTVEVQRFFRIQATED